MTAAELTAARPGLTGVSPIDKAADVHTCEVAPADLKRRTAHGALVTIGAQVGTFLLRIASVMVMARLLRKEDFGLVNMVTAFTGLFALVRDGGLSMAAVQSASITTTQTSALFWVNLAIGGGLAAMAVVIAPGLAAFYGEPRLFWVGVALGTTFIFTGAAAQHRAMLQRGLRFNALAIVDILSVIAGMAAGIGMALAGYGYWSLVGMLIAQPAASVVGSWVASGWIPARPPRRSGIRSMLAYGGAITLHSLTVYLATNVDKVLIGRIWGAEALGVYGRAYQLLNLPLENLNSTIGLVLFPALSRVQRDPARLRSYFLKGYGLFLTVLVPITIACGLMADDIVRVFLGSKWVEAAAIFRLLVPGILAFAFANPFTWLMLAGGKAGRCLRLAAVMTPLLILSYVLGVPHGPQGVAAGLSITMVLAIVPLLQWARHGTLITMRDICRVIAPLLLSTGIGAAAALIVRPGVKAEPAFVQLVVETAVFFGGYVLSLLFVMKQRSVYLAVLEDIGLWPVGSSSRTSG